MGTHCCKNSSYLRPCINSASENAPTQRMKRSDYCDKTQSDKSKLQKSPTPKKLTSHELLMAERRLKHRLRPCLWQNGKAPWKPCRFSSNSECLSPKVSKKPLKDNTEQMSTGDDEQIDNSLSKKLSTTDKTYCINYTPCNPGNKDDATSKTQKSTMQRVQKLSPDSSASTKASVDGESSKNN